MTDETWNLLLHQVNADPKTSSLNQNPNDRDLEQCSKAVHNDGTMEQLNVKSFGKYCPGYTVYLECKAK